MIATVCRFYPSDRIKEAVGKRDAVDVGQHYFLAVAIALV